MLDGLARLGLGHPADAHEIVIQLRVWIFLLLGDQTADEDLRVASVKQIPDDQIRTVVAQRRPHFLAEEVLSRFQFERYFEPTSDERVEFPEHFRRLFE